MTSNQEAVKFAVRHYHLADWTTRVVFQCVEATLPEASKGNGRVKWIRSDRSKCAMRRKLDS